ncbi:MAG: hypothetical protein H6867_03240 [Rhodospirillales bacterium]|nr:hypothetical protein [Rhodospirillales bacterium]MCB9996166.1 hypothetical protein [Rhodospirillales bacterium]
MAGVGRDIVLSTVALKETFDRARSCGHDHLVHYWEEGLDLGDSMMFGVECYARFEKTLSYKAGEQDSAQQRVLFEHLATHGPGQVIGIYDLALPFAQAVHDVSLISPEIRERAAAEKASRDYKALPLSQKIFRKIFG